MKTWTLGNAKHQFSQLVKLAVTTGPQTVTKFGRPVVVIVSVDEFKRMSPPKETLAEFFAPLKRSGINLTRSKDLGRKPVL
jgi:antitoxin Phd